MNIALLGYGKMGRTIEKVALERGHQISVKVTDDIDSHELKGSDVAIDFSVPAAAYRNITTCFKQGVPVISGTTGWLDKYDDAVEECRASGGAFLYASNFSLGVNLFFELNRKLADLMGRFKEYSVGIEEIHHTQKLDAPSGTAISLAEQIMEAGEKEAWTLGDAGEKEIPIKAERIKDVPGTHKVTYSSEVDEINIEHIAHSRAGFALGAVIAAEWIQNKKGVFSMKDVLF